MTPHAWKDTRKGNPVQRMMSTPTRRCSRCGLAQAQVEDHNWGRLISRRWEPKAPRHCRKKKS